MHVTLPVWSSCWRRRIAHIDPDYEKAAESLGAGPVRVFLTVTLPLSVPGIVAGVTTAFAWTFSAFATPQLVGGGKVNMVSNLVYQLGFANFNFPFAASLSVAALALTLCVDLSLMRVADAAAWKRSGCIDGKTAVSPCAELSPAALLVVAILGFIILPAAVVAIAAFNDKALLAFPPEQLSLRWFVKAIKYRDFQTGFWNGLIVMLCVVDASRWWSARPSPSCSTATSSALKRLIEGLLLAPLVVPHFTVGLGFLILAAQIGAARGYRRRHRLPRGPGAAVRAAQRLYLAAQSRPAHRAGGREPRRAPGRVLVHRHAAAAAAGAGERLAVRGDPVIQRIHRLAVRDRAAHADAAGRHVQLRARICRSDHGGDLSVIFIVVTATLLVVANAFLGLGKVLNVEQAR